MQTMWNTTGYGSLKPQTLTHTHTDRQTQPASHSMAGGRAGPRPVGYGALNSPVDAHAHPRPPEHLLPLVILLLHPHTPTQSHTLDQTAYQHCPKQARLTADKDTQHVCTAACMFTVLGTKRGPIGKALSMQTQHVGTVLNGRLLQVHMLLGLY